MCASGSSRCSAWLVVGCSLNKLFTTVPKNQQSRLFNAWFCCWGGKARICGGAASFLVSPSLTSAMRHDLSAEGFIIVVGYFSWQPEPHPACSDTLLPPACCSEEKT